MFVEYLAPPNCGDFFCAKQTQNEMPEEKKITPWCLHYEQHMTDERPICITRRQMNVSERINLVADFVRLNVFDMQFAFFNRIRALWVASCKIRRTNTVKYHMISGLYGLCFFSMAARCFQPHFQYLTVGSKPSDVMQFCALFDCAPLITRWECMFDVRAFTVFTCSKLI